MPMDPHADLRIFVWPKIPLLLLSLPLTDVWGPHVSFFFNLLPPLHHALPHGAPSSPPTAARLMELDVGPLVTGGTAMQLAAASSLLRVDQSVRADRELATVVRKVLAMAIVLGEAAAHVLLGRTGPSAR